MGEKVVSARLKGETLERFREYKGDETQSQAVRELIKSGLNSQQLSFVNYLKPILALLFGSVTFTLFYFGPGAALIACLSFVTGGVGWVVGALLTPTVQRLSVRLWRRAISGVATTDN